MEEKVLADTKTIGNDELRVRDGVTDIVQKPVGSTRW
jgi:hypothetical protein